MTDEDLLASLDFSTRVTCDVRKSGDPCQRTAQLVIHGSCPQCDAAKPRDFLICKPCWEKLSQMHMRCHKCGSAAEATRFYHVRGLI